MKTKLKNIASNPYINSISVGILVTLLLYLVWDAPIRKYTIETDPFIHQGIDDTHWICDDFNGDGTSERIRCYRGIDSESMDVVHYDENGNITEHFHFTKSYWNFRLKPAVYDIDDNGSKELLFFTYRNDSLFFNAFDLKSFTLVIDHLYFNCIYNKRKTNYALSSAFIDFGDFDNNGTNELFFRFDAGFGLYPRGIFKMDFPSLQISSSPTEFMLLHFSSFADLNGDGIPEMLTNLSAPSNVSTYNKYTDSMSYVTVLDYNLNLLFEPIPMQGQFSTTTCIPSPENDSLFYAMYSGRSNSSEPLKLMLVNHYGEIINQKSWTNIANPENIIRGLKVINNTPYLFFHSIGHFKLTPELNLLPDNLIPNQNEPNITPYCFDLNNDGWDEWISFDKQNNISIYDEHSREKLSFASPVPIKYTLTIYPFFKNKRLRKFMVSTEYGFFFFKYTKNQFYYLLYFVYILTFLVSSGSIYFLLFFQRKTIEKRLQTEKQLSELQFISVKNQLDPHFLFNALNSVAYMINEGKNEEAYDFLTLNSRMIKRLMNDAKTVKRSLRDEIKFTQDYISVQKHRFKDKFISEFIVNSNTNLTLQVPMMCIHTYVENAIKHGFRNIKSGGLLKVIVEPVAQGVSIFISDNGMGRKAASAYNDSSGNGIKIMNDFYQLFEKYHGYIINFSINDIEPTGTAIKLRITLTE
jgi:hypothetical protein